MIMTHAKSPKIMSMFMTHAKHQYHQNPPNSQTTPIIIKCRFWTIISENTIEIHFKTNTTSHLWLVMPAFTKITCLLPPRTPLPV